MRSVRARYQAAWAALPHCVSGDSAPANASLADRIKALEIMRARYFGQAKDYRDKLRALEKRACRCGDGSTCPVHEWEEES